MSNSSNDSTYEKAYKYYKQSDYESSIEILKQLDDINSKRLLAGIYSNICSGKEYTDKAINIFKEIIPYDKFYAYELGCLLYTEDRKEEALNYFLQAISDEIPAASYHAAYLYKHFENEDLFIEYIEVSANQKYIFAKEALFKFKNRKKLFYRPIVQTYRVYIFALNIYYILLDKHEERWM